jgi:AcrR family transcriptional regulator
MSGNSRPTRHAVDRRVRRTRDALGDALVGLMHERPFEEITVQALLDRAQVSRSTFYEHFLDKEDLLLGDVEDFWELMSTLLERRGDEAARLAPVKELFAHVRDAQGFLAALKASGKLSEVLELGQGHLARSIEARLVARDPRWVRSSPETAAAASALAGALLSLLTWWIDRGMAASPEEMDALFHRVVRPPG